MHSATARKRFGRRAAAAALIWACCVPHAYSLHCAALQPHPSCRTPLAPALCALAHASTAAHSQPLIVARALSGSEETAALLGDNAALWVSNEFQVRTMLRECVASVRVAN
jgi:hypothetical protein